VPLADAFRDNLLFCFKKGNKPLSLFSRAVWFGQIEPAKPSDFYAGIVPCTVTI